MIIAQNKLGTTIYQREKKTLISTYKGRMEIELGLEHLAEVVAFYKKTEIIGSLVDIKEMYGSFAKIFEYMKEVYYPAAIKSGLKCQSFVVSKDLIINNLSSKLKELATSFNLKSEIFLKRNDAEKWIKLTL